MCYPHILIAHRMVKCTHLLIYSYEKMHKEEKYMIQQLPCIWCICGLWSFPGGGWGTMDENIEALTGF